jgi:hypothetical protein
MPTPPERARAYRLRAKMRKGDTLEAEDAAWLGSYEQSAGDGDGAFGASASSKTIHVEEKRAAVGIGASAAEIAAHAALAREEGRRIDYLTEAAVKALAAAAEQSREAAALYRDMVKDLRRHTSSLEEVHLSMLDAVRDQYLARTQAEIDAMAAREEDKGDATSQIVEQLLPVLLERMGVSALPKKGKAGS